MFALSQRAAALIRRQVSARFVAAHQTACRTRAYRCTKRVLYEIRRAHRHAAAIRCAVTRASGSKCIASTLVLMVSMTWRCATRM